MAELQYAQICDYLALKKRIPSALDLVFCATEKKMVSWATAVVD